MPEFTQEIDINVDDFLDQCSDNEIDEVIQYLVERNYLKHKSTTKITRTDFIEMFLKIANNRHQLTNEDEQLIINIFNKIV